MEITKIFYPKDWKQWRNWLKKNHKTAKEIWLIYYKKHSGIPRISYNDAVDQALCFGWIDSTLKSIDKDKYAQRFTPRRNGSTISELNKERVRRLIKKGQMTKAGLDMITEIHEIYDDKSNKSNSLKINFDILKLLKEDKKTWQNFQKFPQSYKKIRIGWIEAARHRPDIFQTPLNYFLKMTKRNKKYGIIE